MNLITMDCDNYFYEQTRLRGYTKRFKKMPEDLPDSLKFAHLNPKVAAYLANKEKQKQDEEMFGDSLGKKSLMPEISQAFNAVKNRLDTSLSNDEDSQRYLFEEARGSAATILMQLSRIIYYYDNICNHIPKSLEYQLLSGYSELTNDIQVVPREWQTMTMKEAYLRRITELTSDEEPEKVNASVMEDGRSSRAHSVTSESGRTKKRLLAKGTGGLPEIVENNEMQSDTTRTLNPKRSDSRVSIVSRKSKERKGPGSVANRSPAPKRNLHDYDFMSALTETPSDTRSTAMANPSYLMSIIQFQLSSKDCEEKGWIIQKGREDELAKEAIIEWCVQLLLQAQKLIKEQKIQEMEKGLVNPVIVRYYGDLRKDSLLKLRKSPTRINPNSSFKGNKPRIPNMYDDFNNEGKQLMITGHLDGTTVAYYPSGRPAIVSVASGMGSPGNYTIVYDDDPDLKMLGVFTPIGRGVCYHNNGVVRFLATRKGGHIANREGRVIRHWKWPQAQVKLTTPVHFQMNHHLSFRCVSENYIIVLFSCQKESTRFFVNAAPGAYEHKPDENDQLQTNCSFSSKSAKDLLRLFAPKTKKSKGKKKEKMMRGQLADLVKSFDLQEKLLYDNEADKELARLQRKAKNLVDDWMEHYRITVGLKSPSLDKVYEMPRTARLGAYSAKPAGDRERRRTTMGITVPETVKEIVRVPSAPTRAMSYKPRIESAASETVTNSPPNVKFDHRLDSHDLGCDTEEGDDGRAYTIDYSDKISRMSASSFRSKSASSRTKTISRQPTAISLPEKENLSGNLNLCPLALRLQMLSDERPQCKCSRHSVPFITDVEFNHYINESAPRNQLQIILVVSSLYPNTVHSENVLNQIYENQNKNRTRPCVQSRDDVFRILKYDINTAGEGSNHTQPLLLTRHNIVPGMFLIYADGKLLFCDHIFNGYGNTKTDFRKQVMKSRFDFIKGFSLPQDFRFSPSQGVNGPRAPWGGEIGGTGVDNFGNPGTALARTLTDLEQQDGLSKSQTDNIRSAHQSLGDILNMQHQDSDRRNLDIARALSMTLSGSGLQRPLTADVHQIRPSQVVVRQMRHSLDNQSKVIQGQSLLIPKSASKASA